MFIFTSGFITRVVVPIRGIFVQIRQLSNLKTFIIIVSYVDFPIARPCFLNYSVLSKFTCTVEKLVILLWAERRPSGGKAPGHVTDHMNGTYSGRVSVHWSGQTRIFVKLASARENLCLRLKAMKKYGNSVYALKTPYGIHYRFIRFSAIEYTRCSSHNFVYGYKSLCNFTSLNGGLSWFCGKPSKTEGLDCSSFNQFQMKPYNERVIVPRQPKVEEINEAGHCVFNLRLFRSWNRA